MKVKSLGKNQTEIEFEKDHKSITIFISYETPVAALVKTDKWRAYKTNVYYSVTTSRHINQWLGAWKDEAEEINQDVLDRLLSD